MQFLMIHTNLPRSPRLHLMQPCVLGHLIWHYKPLFKQLNCTLEVLIFAGKGKSWWTVTNHVVNTSDMFKALIQFALRVSNKYPADMAALNTQVFQNYSAFWNLVLDASWFSSRMYGGRPEIKWAENERGAIFRKLPALCMEEDSKENCGENLPWWTERRKMIQGMVNKDRK